MHRWPLFPPCGGQKHCGNCGIFGRVFVRNLANTVEKNKSNNTSSTIDDPAKWILRRGSTYIAYVERKKMVSFVVRRE